MATQDRRSLILEKAAEIFAAKGISGTTVREIADAAGVLSGSLYHHFASKDDIVAAIVMRYLTDLTASYQAIDTSLDPTEQFVQLVQVSLAVIESHPYATEIYQNGGKYLHGLAAYDQMREAATQVQRRWIALLEDGVASGAFRDDVAPRVLYRLVRDALWLSVRWYAPSKEYPTEAFAADFVSVFLNGINRSPGVALKAAR